MKKINNVTIHQNYRREYYDLYDFDHLKDISRAQGVVHAEATLLCGVNQFKMLKDLMRDFFNDHEVVARLRPYTRRFMKNGITYFMYEVYGLDPWSMIVLPGLIDDSEDLLK